MTKFYISPLKAWLRKQHIKQSDLAGILGVSVSTVNVKLNGKQPWLSHDLRRINEVYGLSADFVLGLKKPRHEVTARGRGMDHQKNVGNGFGEVRSDSISPVLAAFVKGGME